MMRSKNELNSMKENNSEPRAHTSARLLNKGSVSLKCNIPEVVLDLGPKGNVFQTPPPEYFSLHKIANKTGSERRRSTKFQDDGSSNLHTPSISRHRSTTSDAVDGIVALLSALYAKILIVIGICKFLIP